MTRRDYNTAVLNHCRDRATDGIGTVTSDACGLGDRPRRAARQRHHQTLRTAVCGTAPHYTRGRRHVPDEPLSLKSP
jgi:hypothetical protein